MRKLTLLTIIAGISGGTAHELVGLLWHPPIIVGGCIAGAVGYITAWAAELYMNRKPTFTMEWWGR